MAQSQPNLSIDEATYARLAEESETRLEWIGGAIIKMAGASIPHAKIANRIATEINLALGDGNCEAVTSDVRVHVEATGDNFYPDVVLVCDDTEYYQTLPHTILSPTLVVEILSPTTQNTDLEYKLDVYQRIPSLRHYLIVSQNRIRVQHYSRRDQNHWDSAVFYWRHERVPLAALGIELPLERIYRNLNVPEGLTLVPMPQDSE